MRILILLISIFTINIQAGKIIQLPGNDAYDDVSIPVSGSHGVSTHSVHVKGTKVLDADVSYWCESAHVLRGVVIELKTYPTQQGILALDTLTTGVGSCGFHDCIDDQNKIILAIPHALKTCEGETMKDGQSLADHLRDVLTSPKRYKYSPLSGATQDLAVQNGLFFMDSAFMRAHHVLEVTPKNFADVARFHLES